MDCTIAAVCVYVIINAVLTGSNTILVRNGKGMVLSLKIIGNSAVNLLYGITVRTEYFTILLDRAYQRLGILSSINWC